VAKRETTECQYPDCTASAKKKGVCAKHFGKRYALGCTVEGCVDPKTGEAGELFAKGRCRVHYMRDRRIKEGKAAPPPDAPIRNYGQKERIVVFTRIGKDVARAIVKASGRPKGMYEKAAEILTEWAERQAAG
jgi:hypothetical protein